jgi:hypothetical protein
MSNPFETERRGDKAARSSAIMAAPSLDFAAAQRRRSRSKPPLGSRARVRSALPVVMDAAAPEKHPKLKRRNR